MTALPDEVVQARYVRLVRLLEKRLRRKARQQGTGCRCGHLLIDRAEVERWERDGIPLHRLRRAAREAARTLGWQAATHLDPVGRLSVYDAAPVVDEDVSAVTFM